MTKEELFTMYRQKLVKQLRSSLAIRTKEVEQAFLNIKRELFIPKEMQEFSYQDDALPIGEGQTISQPTTIAVMLEMLAAKKDMQIAEVGSGSGYVTALLASIVGEKGKVIGCEIIKVLAEKSKENLKTHGIENVTIVQGDASEIIPKQGFFDRILISAACPFIPKPLFDSIKEGGIAVAPIGDQGTQILTKVTKIKGKPVKEEFIDSYFIFVPMRGKHGFKQL